MEIKVTTTLRKISGMKKRIRCIAGSQGASKSFSILLIIINHCSSKADKKWLIVSEELSKMRTNIIPDFLNIMKSVGIFKDSQWRETDCLYSFPNGSSIKFMGADKSDLGKGTRTDGVFFNEANKISFEAYRELSTRSNNIFIDYNPNYHCWIDDNVIPRDDCQFLRVTFEDNEALGEAERNEILRYKEMAYNPDGSVKSEYWLNIWKVYGKGETGSFVGTIFTNITTGVFDDSLVSVYGLDIGYKDEDSVIKVAIDNKKKLLYAEEIIFQNNLSSNQLSTLIKAKIGSKLIVCDSAAAKTIADLKQNGVNAVSCRKNRIVDDIKDIQGYQIVVCGKSPNLQRELNNYRWLDKEGKSIPMDGEIHLVDSMRYAFSYLKNPVKKSSVMVW